MMIIKCVAEIIDIFKECELSCVIISSDRVDELLYL